MFALEKGQPSRSRQPTLTVRRTPNQAALARRGCVSQIALTTLILLLCARGGLAAEEPPLPPEFNALSARIEAKTGQGEKTEAQFTDELKALDAMLAKHQGEKTEDVTWMLCLKARRYDTILTNQAQPAGEVQWRQAATPAAALAVPFEVGINPEAGRGGLLVVKLRVGGIEELPFIVDTGSPGTVLDKSLEPRLGKRLGEQTIWTLTGRQQARLYHAPGLKLGAIPLRTGSNILTADIHKMVPRAGTPVKGILGMDSLCHYCLQLDFKAQRMRFLDSTHLERSTLGKSFPLTLAREERTDLFRLWIDTPGLLGGTQTNSVLDTGCNLDGLVEKRAIRERAAGSYTGGLFRRLKHLLAVSGLVHRGVGLPRCTWEGNSYTDIAVGKAPNDAPGFIGLRFLARHLVTLDFPQQTGYLNQRSIGPLAVESSPTAGSVTPQQGAAPPE